MKSIGVTCLIALSVLVVGIGLHILCMSTSYFFTLSDSDTRQGYSKLGYDSNVPLSNTSTLGLHIGLWRLCVDDINGTFCQRIARNTTDSDWIKPCQALSIIGVLVASVAMFSTAAWALIRPMKVPHLFLVVTIVCSVSGGVVILSSDITFAAHKTIAFYAAKERSSYFFNNKVDTSESRAYEIKVYDDLLVHGWSIILDLISGSLCIVAGAVYIFTLFLVTSKKPSYADEVRKEQMNKFSDMLEGNNNFGMSRM